jgi:membrane protein
MADMKRLLMQTWTEWNKDNAPRLGAALAYYTTLSLAPLLILVIAIAGLVLGEEAARGQLMRQVGDLIGKEGGEAVQNMVQAASKPAQGTIASIIGFLVLLFGASTVAAELRASLNEIWNKQPAESGGLKEIVTERSYALGVVLGCGFLLLVSLVVSSGVAAAGEFMGGMLPVPEVVLHVINIAVGIVVIAGVFAVLFKYLPDVNIEWRDVFLGALFTSVLFAIGRVLIGLYLGKASFGSTYGAAGSLVIVLVWVYYSSQILFFGAEFTQVYAREHGSDPLRTRRRHHSHTQPEPQPAAAPGTGGPAHGNTALAGTGERTAGLFGGLIGSALAATRIFRTLKR